VAADRYTETLCRLGTEAGLDAVGVAAATVFASTREILHDRRAQGQHGDMAFTYRNPERSTDPSRVVADAAAIVVGARTYLRAEADAARGPGSPGGTVARYAWVDHYAPLRAALGVVADRLRADGWRAVVVSDDNALVDREAAYRAGLGWYGKNANLLLPGRGSWFVLGSVVTNAPLEPAREPVADGCGACHRCIDACPTGAIVAPGVVDARRCLAWILQRPGSIPVEFRVALGDRLYGCDDCQTVCPPNVRFGRAEAIEADADPTVDLVELLDGDDADLLARHGRWYIAGRDPRWLRRNALVALGNVGDDQADPVLVRYRDGDDDVLAEHAAWALRRRTDRAAST
jgi:epoxyqueuosine reductase